MNAGLWSDKHRIGAKARAHRLAAAWLESGKPGVSLVAAIALSDFDTRTEATFCDALAHAGLSEAEIAREVERVRAWAEGRIEPLPGSEFYRVRLLSGEYLGDVYEDGENREGPVAIEDTERITHGTSADQCAGRHQGSRVCRVRVTRQRIRRAGRTS